MVLRGASPGTIRGRDGRIDERDEREPIFGLRGGACQRHRACRPRRAASGLLPWAVAAGRAQERGADGGGDGSGTGLGTASVVAASGGGCIWWGLHLVGKAPWSDERVLAKVRELVLPSIERTGRIEAWIIDDTGFPKKGRHSVGVTRQYCGQLGKQDNCQVAVSLSIANHAASLPVAYRLYLPEDWANDPLRRAKAGVPANIAFATKPMIALAQIRAAVEAGVARGVVLMDAGYGSDTNLRTEITALGLSYAVGVLSSTSVWPPGLAPLPAREWTGRGRPPKCCVRRDGEHKPVQAKALALGLAETAWEVVTWREGSADWLSSRFARVPCPPGPS